MSNRLGILESSLHSEERNRSDWGEERDWGFLGSHEVRGD